MKQSIFYLLIVIFLSSCTLPKMLIDDNLKSNTDSYKVEGVNGFSFNQVISFGDFKTGKINKGWRTTTSTSFILDKVESNQKINFDISGPKGMQATISTAARCSKKDLELFNKTFSVHLSNENTFIGSIASPDFSWQFAVSAKMDQNFQNTAIGILMDTNEKIDILEVRSFDTKYKTLSSQVVGYEFKQGSLSLGAVQVVNGGNVWIRTGLPEKTRFIIAAASAALLVKPDLEK